MSYIVKRATCPVSLNGDFENDPQWKEANVISVANRMYPKYNIFKRLWRKMTGVEERERQDPYCPQVDLKLLYDDQNIYGLFRVKDQYVRAVASKRGDQACYDSCVEFFIRPANNVRYYNFEITAGGFMLLYNITNLRKRQFSVVSEEDCNTVERYHDLPAIIDPEITEPTTWHLGFKIPIALFVKLGDDVNGDLAGQTWTANVYKCGDMTSHPHWLTWLPIPKLDFHQPEFFGDIIFEA